MIQIATFVFNEFQENTYLAWDETRECLIVDPGCYLVEEQNLMASFIADNGLKPIAVLNTHCHIDHILGNIFATETYQVPLYLHKEELSTYADTARWADMFGIPEQKVPEQKVFIDEGDLISFGGSSFQIAFTPGHSVASLSFYNTEEKIALSGDVLFRESIGRTDLPGGNLNTLLASIQTKLFVLNDEMLIYSGHGPTTTIGHEKRYNPYLS